MKNSLRLELKVCESCGVLWLRKCAGDGVYCVGCKRRLADFPAPRRGGVARKPQMARVSWHGGAKKAEVTR